MKKIILVLVILIYCDSFSWNEIELKDKFGSPVGLTRIYQKDSKNNGTVFIDKVKNRDYMIAFLMKESVNNEPVLKIKIDENSSIYIKASIIFEGRGVIIKLPSKLEKEMREGKIMEVVIDIYKKEKILLEFNIEGFEKALIKNNNVK